MILARCPHCETTFRATPEALKLRAGKVRCGKCQEVFNALDYIVVEASIARPSVEPFPGSGFELAPTPSDETSKEIKETVSEAASTSRPVTPVDEPTGAETETESDLAPSLDTGERPGASQILDNSGVASNAQPDVALPSEATSLDLIDVQHFDETTPDTPTSPEVTEAQDNTAPSDPAVTQDTQETESAETTPPHADPLFEAKDAGLMAVRDTSELPGYSKWNEGTLSAPSMQFEEPRRTGWIGVVLALVLTLMMLVQVIHHWRIDIAQRWPDSRPWLEEACRSLDCTVPYPRDASLINLEASELQIDPERGNMIVLHMTIKNRAAFPQAFPSVALTLTDARDNVVVRRILAPEEWLPNLDRKASQPEAEPISTPDAFPASKEIAARLWIDAKDTGAVGYRLFVFYP